MATPRTAFPLPPVGDGAIDVPKKRTPFAVRDGYRLSLFMFFLSIRKERTKESASFLRGGNNFPWDFCKSHSVNG